MRFLANARNDRTFGETKGKEKWFATSEPPLFSLRLKNTMSFRMQSRLA